MGEGGEGRKNGREEGEGEKEREKKGRESALSKLLLRKKKGGQAVVAFTFNPSTLEAKAGRSL